jgi:signal peptide peptidase SppA
MTTAKLSVELSQGRHQTRGDKRVLRFAHINEYLGYWAMHAGHFKMARNQVMPHLQHYVERFGTAEASRAAMMASGTNGQYELSPEGTAIIEIRGTMMKFASSFGGGGTVAAKRKMRLAANDPYVKQIVIVIDSPGGTVSGTQDLADEVAKTAKSKPVYVQIEDLCCSAAYWVASQATRIFANATALGPCIGTYMVVDDWSKAFDEAGIKTHLVKAGAFKGAGVQGTEITDEHLRAWQVEVDDLNEQFVRGVARGRGVALARAKDWADGRVMIASKMLDSGLIDGIQTLDETLAMAAARKPPRKSTAAEDPAGEPLAAEPTEIAAESLATDLTHAGEEPQQQNPEPASGSVETEATGSASADITQEVEEIQMSTTTEPKAATIAEIEASCKGADEKFVLGQLKKSATVEQAQTAWIAELADRQAAGDQRVKDAEAKAAAAEEKAEALAKRPGNSAPLGGAGPKTDSAAAEDDDDVEGGVAGQWKELVATHMKKGGGRTRAQAVVAAAAANPQLHEAYLADYNARNEGLAGEAKRRK